MNELHHHGIKGMKWGVRRYQNKDGTLTAAGKKRDAEFRKREAQVKTLKSDFKISRRAYQKAMNRYSNVKTDSNLQRLKETETQYRKDEATYKKVKLLYDTDKEAVRLRDNNIQISNKSKHRLRLEEQYKQMGMSDEQAQAAANNRIRTEKILAATAALTVTACAAYVANKHLKTRIDGVIKAGEILQRIEMKDTGGKLHDMFYAAKGRHDSTRYANLLGYERQKQTGHAYLMKLQANADIKVASRDKATKIFGELYKNDPEFKKSVEMHVKQHFSGRNVIRDLNDLSDKNIKRMYENFNSDLMMVRNISPNAGNKFYSKLKAAGYGAIQDINDMKYSGYNAKNPLIIFDNSKGNVMVKSMSEMTGNLKKAGDLEIMKVLGENYAKQFIEIAGPASVVVTTSKTVKTYRSDPNDEYK